MIVSECFSFTLNEITYRFNLINSEFLKPHLLSDVKIALTSQRKRDFSLTLFRKLTVY